MATIEEKKALAKIKFVQQGKTQKQCAEEVDVSTVTMSNWVNKYKWRLEREARVTGSKSQKENVNIIISNIADRMVEAQRERDEARDRGDNDRVKELTQELVGLGDQAAKVKGMLTAIENRNKLTLSQYIEVMDSIFGDMQNTEEDLYYRTIDFQRSHIEKIAAKYEN